MSTEPQSRAEAAEPPKETRYVCLGCEREGQFDAYEIERDPLSGAVQHWDESKHEWCGPVEPVKGESDG
jgi:hypothetical protein